MIERLRWFLIRQRYRWQIVRHSGAELNRRVTVEAYLLDCAAGKRPLPDASKCRELALNLGVPSDFGRKL
ncbi:hypothetical protein [Pseudazoarcus pumilus]|uniref:Uncharacterized protein n=1 Tax=Pseudazoarcus pumilus TaxID=2067960 RepID=A0A2I6S836_9RHOO|nr:hypothetical protein [Pseudazoarcus pumilus]AUN95415.1 hypothetical protein C0099_11040 [Pseudazoarcus pumilus]|tara:strand:+ start:3335 stop:3544 length:210 start_codon:yes stop_codon:yes gene_type:complete